MPLHEPSSDGVRRVADLTLRGPDGPLRVRVHWPTVGGREPVVLLGNDDHLDELSRTLCGGVNVVLSLAVRPGASARRSLDAAISVTGWAVDHASELDADPRGVVVAGVRAGVPVAVAVAILAREQGWPPVVRLVLVDRLLDRAPTSARARPDPGPVTTAG